MPSLVEIGESGSGEEDENEKSSTKPTTTTTTPTTTDKYWSEKLTWAFGSGELNMLIDIIYRYCKFCINIYMYLCIVKSLVNFVEKKVFNNLNNR